MRLASDRVRASLAAIKPRRHEPRETRTDMPTTMRDQSPKSAKASGDDSKPAKSRAKRRAKPAADAHVADAHVAGAHVAGAQATGARAAGAPSGESSDEAPKRKKKSKSLDAKRPPEAKKPSARAARSRAEAHADADAADTTRDARSSKKRADSPAPKPGGNQRAPIDLGTAVLQALATNERMNQFLLENLDDRAWMLPPRSGQGRTIAAIVAHMHNVRHMWLQVTSKGTAIPDKLDRSSVTKSDAMNALAKSGQALLALFERSLENGGRVKDFRPDVVGFLGYVIAHEAHHRGQINMLAREIGFPVSKETNFGLWDWNKRWKECGY